MTKKKKILRPNTANMYFVIYELYKIKSEMKKKSTKQYCLKRKHDDKQLKTSLQESSLSDFNKSYDRRYSPFIYIFTYSKTNIVKHCLTLSNIV